MGARIYIICGIIGVGLGQQAGQAGLRTDTEGRLSMAETQYRVATCGNWVVESGSVTDVVKCYSTEAPDDVVHLGYVRDDSGSVICHVLTVGKVTVYVDYPERLLTLTHNPLG